MDANPNRSIYAFCIDTKRPGCFYLCFKSTRQTPVSFLPVRVIPKGFELMNSSYPDMRALSNGFKLRVISEMQKRQQNGR
jgi:transcription elongation factor SPT6